MNKIYRIVWNKATQTWTAVQETAKSRTKSSRTGVVSSAPTSTGVRFVYTALASAMLMSGVSGTATAATGTEYQAGTDLPCYFDTTTTGVICGNSTTKVNSTGTANAVAIGIGAEAGEPTNTSQAAVAIGWNAKALNTHTVAIGNEAGNGVAYKASNNNGLYIGNGAGKNSGGIQSSGQIAIGQGAGANVGNTTASWSNTAIGLTAGNAVNGAHNVALGSSAGSSISASNTVSIGRNATGSAESATAIGYGAKSQKESAIAMGTDSIANGLNAISIGKNNNVSGDNSGAIGGAATGITGIGTYSLGNANGNISASEAGVFGNNNTLSGSNSRIIGNNNEVDKEDVFVLGNNVTSTLANSVFLGTTSAYTSKGANSDGDTTVSNANVNGLTYYGFAGHTPVGVVSVGDIDKERRIQNVAAGLISSTSTDAINGSQLYQVIDQGGFTVQQNGANVDLLKWGDTINFTNGDGTTAAVVTDANGKVNNVQYNVAVDGRTIKINQDGKLYADVANTNTVTTLTAGNGVTVTNTGTADAPNYNVSVNTTPLSTTNGTVTTPTNPNALATAGDIANAINSTGFVLTAQGANGSMVNPGETVDMKNTDGNIIISKATTDNAVNYNLAKDIKVDSVKTGDATINTDGLTITGGPSVTKTGIDAADKKITNVTSGDISATSKDAVNGSQLYALQNNINTQIAASKEEVTSSNKTVNVTTTTNNTTGANTYDLSINTGRSLMVDATTGVIDVKTDGNTITTDSGTGAIKANTVNLTTNSNGTVTTPTNPNALATAGDIANAINGAGFNLTTSASAGVVTGTTTERINAGKTVTVDAGKNIAVIQSGGVITVATADDVKFNSVTSNNITVNQGGKLTIGSNSTVDMGGNKITNVAEGVADSDVVTVSQLKAAAIGGNTAILNDMNNRIDDVEDESNAGVSSAMAMAALPQAYIPGKSMLTGGMATYNGEGAVAVGFSKLSDNGRWVLKMSGSADTQGNAGAAVGAGFHF